MKLRCNARNATWEAFEAACRLARDLIDELIKADPIDLREAKTKRDVEVLLENSAYLRHGMSFARYIYSGLQRAGYDVAAEELWPNDNWMNLHDRSLDSACKHLAQRRKAGLPSASVAIPRIIENLAKERYFAARSPLFGFIEETSGHSRRQADEEEPARVDGTCLRRLLQLGMVVMRGRNPVIPADPSEKEQARESLRKTVAFEVLSRTVIYRDPIGGWKRARSGLLSTDEEELVTRAVGYISETPWW